MFSPGKWDGATRGLGTDANSESRVGSAQVHVKFAIPTDSQEKVGVVFKLKEKHVMEGVGAVHGTVAGATGVRWGPAKNVQTQTP
ncbi:hypothetical protein PAL_GLEAN10008688 [Pteropus alecto]|uniref:Uncharacterized protein n=1 Tax=Pteropus alecto TaxID=9402 RepID=L5KS31_PTEAL|nr:hypothetical protein PAL_GLEAN10008688 [Pteropus alecto]